ncbi:MAG: hypothetical protein RL380_1621 [Verrucomicrobiota bacterium]|jgi:beta-galactosidase
MSSRFGKIFSLLLVVVAVRAAARELTPLNDGWRFQPGYFTNAASPIFDDAGWTNLALPHCWGWELAQRGEKYQRAPGWYRRELKIQPQPGRRYFVRFEAAGSVADVYLNGKFLGQHRGAFGAFSFELTKNLFTNGVNLLAMRVSNEPQPDVAPVSGDFPMYGGLYRGAALLETADVCVTPTDHASPGVAWLQTSVTAEKAELDVTAWLSNPTKKSRPLMLVANVLDADGQIVVAVTNAITVVSNSTAPLAWRVTVPRPHRWHGLADPYLYRAVVELRAAEGVIDSVEQPLGLRSFRVDPDHGFFLNDQPYHLHGVNRHQDRPDKGWALSAADQDEDMALLKELGATAVRCAHYQHSEYFYSACDRAGILVWAEIPLVDSVTNTAQFAETSRNQLLDLIRQNVNHPAIFCWSLFNELRPNHPDPHRLLQDLNVVAHGEDPTRPTIAATCTWGLPQMNQLPDLLGWNIYPGWYPEWKPLADTARQLDSYRATSRRGGVCLSEYGAGANAKQHEQNSAQPKADGQWHPEEWQGIVHEEVWKQLRARPFVWGAFIWNFADFTSFWRKEGGVKGLNDKGILTFDRQTKKDAFYFYQANWNDRTETLHLTSQRHAVRTNAVTDVKVYSNARAAELFLNAASQGRQTNDGNAVFVWKNLTLRPGENLTEVRATIHGTNVTDRCVWTLTEPSKL